ncbi:hypothetical protein GCM10007159_41440 [Modicisalibacter luteus]|nr:hypothetical protein GCM10007159_41440 [Halomonas lutea]
MGFPHPGECPDDELTALDQDETALAIIFGIKFCNSICGSTGARKKVENYISWPCSDSQYSINQTNRLWRIEGCEFKI